MRFGSSCHVAFGAALVAAILAGCSAARPPMPTVDHVDLDRFMGDWYVIASIPTWLERDAYGAVESYRRVGDREIATTFTFRRGGFDGTPKRYEPTGYVCEDPSNAVWGMQFVWPIKADYRIVYLNDDYSQTAIGRTKRDYVWIMARTPTIPAGDYRRIAGRLEELGYDLTPLVKVPQRPE